MDTWNFEVPEIETDFWCLLYSKQSDAIQANEVITDNMELPIDSETIQWDNVFEIISGEYAGMYGIKKPDEDEMHLMDGVMIELEAKYSDEWFQDIE